MSHSENSNKCVNKLTCNIYSLKYLHGLLTLHVPGCVVPATNTGDDDDDDDNDVLVIIIGCINCCHCQAKILARQGSAEWAGVDCFW